MGKGYIHLYTGDGKGKTTAALGLALRAAGAGLQVWIGQFVKGCEYSEHHALKRYSDCITLRQYGRRCFIKGKPEEQDIQSARQGLMEAASVLEQGDYDMIILDEACIALHFNLFSTEELLAVLAKKPEHVELILTGRNAPEELISSADLVTEMREVKHYYTQGVQARKGIEE
jgi:cob(I)alamin adenosyltransferase